MKPARWRSAGLLLAALALLTWALSLLAARLTPYATDWWIFWNGTHNFTIEYFSPHMVHPPWMLALVWPLTAWSFEVSWALSLLATLLVLALCVPRSGERRRWLLGLALLLFAYPAMRQMADGNFEALVIGGALLLLWAARQENAWGLAAALVLLSAKVQASWLLVLAAAVWLWRNWPRRKLWAGIGLALAYMLPFALWKGGEWLARLRSFPFVGAGHDISLRSNLARLGLPAAVDWLLSAAILVATLAWLWKRRELPGRGESGWLVTAALLLAPYSAATSVLTPLAIGLLPLALDRPRLGLPLVGLHYLVYLMLPFKDLQLAWEAPYWTVVLVINWLMVGWLLKQKGEGQTVS